MRRRFFVRSGALALVTIGLSPAFLRRLAFAARRPQGSGRILIVLFQRGAADGLNIVVPHGEPLYYEHRPTIGIPRPLSGNPATAIDLDGFFGLHPALAPLKPLYDRGMLAPVQAVGSPSSSRSHFDAQAFMETATPDVKTTEDGWLNRYLQLTRRRTPLRAMALTARTPLALAGPAPAIAMAGLSDFLGPFGDAEVQRFEALYRAGSADLIHGAGAEAFEAMKLLQAVGARPYAPAGGARYPGSAFGRALLQIAQLIKSDVGLEIAFADVDGWDTHVNQGGVSGQLAQRLDDFGRTIAALVTDLGDRMGDVAIVTLTEFGRMVKQNGAGGTDHGHAGTVFVVGGAVKGGRVLGRWPGLAEEQLFERRDLAVTTDFRTVLWEVVERHLGADRLESVFPGFEPGGERLGLL